MTTFRIVVSRSAEKDLKKIPRQEQSKIIKQVDGLGVNPRPDGAKKLAGSGHDLWRIRSGDYRVIYSIETEVRIVDIRRIRHRKDVYRT